MGCDSLVTFKTKISLRSSLLKIPENLIHHLPAELNIFQYTLVYFYLENPHTNLVKLGNAHVEEM